MATDKANRSASLLGVPIGCGSLEEIVSHSLRAIDGSVPQITFACANPHSLVEASENNDVLTALRETEIVVADGVGVSLIGHALRIDIGPRITGAEYFHALMNALEERGGGRVYFFGSSQGVLDRIGARFRRDFPSLTLCGTLSPPYRDWSREENEAMLQQINDARPDLLWVGMTAPKQELWVYANAGRLNAHAVGSIGAVFDFYAETNPRAPQWMRHLGLEWVYRLMREPRRLWRRTVISAPRFMLKAIVHHFVER